MKFHTRLVIVLVAICLFLLVLLEEPSFLRTNLSAGNDYIDVDPAVLQSDIDLLITQEQTITIRAPPAVADRNATTDILVKRFLNRYDLHWNSSTSGSISLWKIASHWITARQIHSEHAPELGEDTSPANFNDFYSFELSIVCSAVIQIY